MTSQASIQTNTPHPEPPLEVPPGTAMAITMLGPGALFIGTDEFASMSPYRQHDCRYVISAEELSGLGATPDR